VAAASGNADAAADHRKKPDIAGRLDLDRGNAVSVHMHLARETERLAKREGRACMVAKQARKQEGVQ